MVVGGEGAPPWLGAVCAGAVGAPATRRSPGFPGSAAARPGRQALGAVSPAPPSPGSLPLLVHSWVRQRLCCVCWKPCLSRAREAQFSPALEARPQPSFSLSSLTLMIQFRPSERCVEPRGLTRSRGHCTLSPCPSDAMCVGNTCDNMQLNTRTCTRRCAHTHGCSASPCGSVALLRRLPPPGQAPSGDTGLTVSSLPVPTPPEASAPPWLPRLANTFLSQSRADDHLV